MDELIVTDLQQTPAQRASARIDSLWRLPHQRWRNATAAEVDAALVMPFEACALSGTPRDRCLKQNLGHWRSTPLTKTSRQGSLFFKDCGLGSEPSCAVGGLPLARRASLFRRLEGLPPPSHGAASYLLAALGRLAELPRPAQPWAQQPAGQEAQREAAQQPQPELHILGDSVGVQLFGAAKCELRRLALLSEAQGHGNALGTDGASEAAAAAAALSRIRVARIGDRPDAEGLATLEREVGAAVARVRRAGGGVVLASIGLHFDDEQRDAHAAHVTRLLQLLEGCAADGLGCVPILATAVAQHFRSPTGSFYAHGEHLGAGDYPCVPLRSPHPPHPQHPPHPPHPPHSPQPRHSSLRLGAGAWRAADTRELARRHAPSHTLLLPFDELSRGWWDAHLGGSARRGNGSRADCTHLCQGPWLLEPLWWALDVATAATMPRAHEASRAEPAAPVVAARHPLVSRIGIVIARWQGWPGWTPLLIRTLAFNELIHFHLLSDVEPPVAPLPQNVLFHRWTLRHLLLRMQRTVGLQLESISASGRQAGNDMSSAKINDLKPMLGEAFADLLRPYDWWGYLQEDLLVGDLTQCLSPALLRTYDVINSFGPPYNSSGVFMLFRNVPRVNRIWRLSSDASEVLRTSEYLIFDEWWGPLADDFSTVLGREHDKGTIRLWRPSDPPEPQTPHSHSHHESPNMFGDDLHIQTKPMLACWHRGELVHNGGSGVDYDQMPCMGMRPTLQARAAASRVCMMHFVVSKRLPGLAQLPSPLPSEAASAVAQANEFALTRDGLWLPAEPNADRDIEGSWMLVRGGNRTSWGVETFSHVDVLRYFDRLSEGAIARRIASERAQHIRAARGALPIRHRRDV